MHTPLYINNTYCLSFAELKSLLRVATSEKGQLYEDFLIIILDGILDKWLREGSEEECSLANKLHDYNNPRHALNRLCLELDLPTIL